MIKEKLKEDLFDKIADNAKIVIFGAGEIGQKIFKDIRKEKPNVQILGFIDNFLKGNCLDLPIWTIKQFVDSKISVDLVVMSTNTNENIIHNILSLYRYKILAHSKFLYDFYRKTSSVLNEANYNSVISIFDSEKDRRLFEEIFQARKKIINAEVLKDYYNKHYFDISKTETTIEKQYLEKINKNVIHTVYDLGMNSGLNIIAFNKKLPNLQKIFGFEAIYNNAKVSYIEDFILNDKLQIVEAAVGEKKGITSFMINTNSSYSSFSDSISTKKLNLNNNHWEKVTLKMTNIDIFSKDNNIKPDFIKMDIEGAEMAALKGGMKTIQTCRPQLAISIYHSDEDFINIPLYLNENLKNYKFSIGHYHPSLCETVLYAIPNELL